MAVSRLSLTVGNLEQVGLEAGLGCEDFCTSNNTNLLRIYPFTAVTLLLILVNFT